ncbi:GNAT family N-acetyltransferase [Alkalihalobacillus sp. R86527]|uniref:GNAT family N-acetyltransferase n=1 Tax=Alkalihalobacillus sp. R86527 TaxID=3093863 RepID=UPI00366D00E3
MKDTDIERVKEIANLTWKNTYQSFIPLDIQEKTLKEAHSEETMMNRFEKSMMLVAEEDEKITGYAFFSNGATNKEIFLESIYVHPSYQEKGIGKDLYLSGIERYENPTSISLTVYKGNKNITFYDKEGFNVINESKGDFCGHPVTFIKMTKKL